MAYNFFNSKREAKRFSELCLSQKEQKDILKNVSTPVILEELSERFYKLKTRAKSLKTIIKNSQDLQEFVKILDEFDEL